MLLLLLQLMLRGETNSTTGAGTVGTLLCCLTPHTLALYTYNCCWEVGGRVVEVGWWWWQDMELKWDTDACENEILRAMLCSHESLR